MLILFNVKSFCTPAYPYPIEVTQSDKSVVTITLKGDESGYTLGVWTDGSYSYSLSLSEALSEADWLTLISGK